MYFTPVLIPFVMQTRTHFFLFVRLYTSVLVFYPSSPLLTHQFVVHTHLRTRHVLGPHGPQPWILSLLLPPFGAPPNPPDFNSTVIGNDFRHSTATDTVSSEGMTCMRPISIICPPSATPLRTLLLRTLLLRTSESRHQSTGSAW